MRMTVRVAALSVPMFLTSLAPSAFGQVKESKAERLQNLRTVLAQENQTIVELDSLKASSSGPHADERESLIKSRDSVQRLVNQIEGKDEEAGIPAHHKRDATAEKNAGAADYYTTIRQVHQQVEDDFTLLEKDPGKKNNNVHIKDAIKYLDEVRGPVGKEVADYELAHPAAAAQAPVAATPAAPMPAAPMPPAAAAPVTPAAPAGPDSRVPELTNAISHLDHSIDYVTAQPASDALRAQTLAAVVKARDAVRQLVDELTNKDVAKDLQSDHARDAAAPTKKLPDYYTGLVEVSEYLNNDHTVIVRQSDDPAHIHGQAVQSLEIAYNLVSQQITAYKKAHPNVK